jgi:TolB-like protein
VIAVLATMAIAVAVIFRPGPNDLDRADELATKADAVVGAGPTADVSSPRLASATPAPAPATTEERASIAVLPFVNMSSDAEQEYFSDGLSEELLNQLAQIEDLRVIGRTSSFAFKGQAADLRAVGRTLGVSHFLEGSVRKSGDTLRIVAQLIDASDGSYVWSDTYDRDLVDVFAVQEEIARTVAAELSLTLNVAPAAADYGGAESFEAYDHYLRGRAHASRFEKDELELGIEKFRQALAIEPEYGLAWSALANAAQLLAVLEISRTAELLALQEDAISRALAAAPDRWEVHAQYANLLWQRHDWVGAARAWAEARRLAPPGAPEFSADYGDDFLVQVGRAREGRDALLAARAADPLAPLVSSDTVVALQLAGDFEAASAEYARCKGLPDCIGVAFFHLALLLHVGDRDAVIDLLNDYQTNQPEERAVIEKLARVWDSPAESLALLRTLPDDPAIAGPHILRRFAILAAHYGDGDLALALLREDYFERDGYVAASLWMPQMSKVRRTPEFNRLVRDLGLYDHWRDSGEWGDFCRPLSRDDFECS